MKVQEFALALAEAANVYDALGFDAHSGQRRLVRNRRDDQRAGILERNIRCSVIRHTNSTCATGG